MSRLVLYLDENDQSYKFNTFLLRLTGFDVVEFFNRDELQNWFLNVQFSGDEQQLVLLVGYLNTRLQANTFMDFLADVKGQLPIVQLEMEDMESYSTGHVDLLKKHAEVVSCSIGSVRHILWELVNKKPNLTSLVS